MQRVAQQGSPQKFRKMTWLEPNNANCGTQHLSPSKAMLPYKSRPKGVKTFRVEKRSRLSSIGSHMLTVRSTVDDCGLNHEEIKEAKEMPSKRAISAKPEARVGLMPRFKGQDTHFKAPSSASVESCGLSHDEEKRAREMQHLRASSSKPESGLGGLEHRFTGQSTHFKKPQGADMMLAQQPLEPTPAAVTIPKGDWLKNLWASAGTALEDREMRECDAIIAPVLRIHDDFKQNGVVSNMAAPTGPRFTYQKTTAATALSAYTSHDMVWNTKGSVAMRVEKHSRFSTYGSHFN